MPDWTQLFDVHVFMRHTICMFDFLWMRETDAIRNVAANVKNSIGRNSMD